MKTVILYDSIYGNTEKIAKAIGDAVTGECKILNIRKAKFSELANVDLLIVGSPVHGGRPTPALDEFLKNIPQNFVKGVKVAAFDTRFSPEDHGIGLKILMNIIRYASVRIAKVLTKKGGVLVIKPEGFVVENKEGPLKKGEIERATKWAKEVSKYDKSKERRII